MSSLPDTGYRNLLVSRDGPAARIVLNRPEKRNALSLELMEELTDALREVSAQRDARAIVIEGAGPAFSAGHDLSEMIGREREFLARLFDRCSAMMQANAKNAGWMRTRKAWQTNRIASGVMINPSRSRIALSSPALYRP